MFIRNGNVAGSIHVEKLPAKLRPKQPDPKAEPPPEVPARPDPTLVSAPASEPEPAATPPEPAKRPPGRPPKTEKG
jgi:hypothetical protein